MSTLIGRFLNATKNADGTVMLEFGLGNPSGSQDLTFMLLTSAEATALNAVLTGVTGTKSSAVHSAETKVPIGYHK